MLEHLCKAGEQFGVGECLKERCVNQRESGLRKRTDLIFQSVEIDAVLSSYGSIDHAEQRRGNIDEVDSPFERRGSETADVGHRSATETDEQ